MNKKDTVYPEIRFDKGYFTIHLINSSNVNYKKLVMESGAFFFNDYDDVEKLVNTSTFTKEFQNLSAGSELQIDRSDVGELDFTIWYKMKLIADKKSEPKALNFALVGGKI